MRIVDSHFHLWNLAENSYPWLRDGAKKVFFGDLAPIRKNYLLPDLDKDIGDLNVTKLVHVQANWDLGDPVGETRWLHDIAQDDATNRPNAIVAFADLNAENAAQILEEQAAFPKVRGIRQVVFRPALDDTETRLLDSPVWLENLSRLGDLNLSFDMMLYPQQMVRAAQIIRNNPNITFLIEHTGCPVFAEKPTMDLWRAGMKTLAELPNTAAKISGLGMFDKNWTLQSVRDTVLHVIDVFGPERSMFGSNFPVDSLTSTYAYIWQNLTEITKGFSDDEKAQLFHRSAEKFYRI